MHTHAHFHPAHAPGITPMPDTLYVVTAISNPCRYASRYRLYRTFARQMADAGVILMTVEAAHGERPFEVTEEGNPFNVQVRTSHEIWHKENLLNVGISRLPASAKYIAVIDADLHFTRPDFAHETVQQLQHFQVVQMFESIAYLDGHGRMLPQSQGASFVENWLRGKPLITPSGKIVSNTPFYHPNKALVEYPLDADKPGPSLGAPGGAWAFRRSALDGIGALIDFTILGAADYFMAAGFFGFVESVIPRATYSQDFQQSIIRWQDRALRAVRKNVGCVPGTVIHSFHGKLALRYYRTREEILVKHDFQPSRDLKRDAQGLWQLEDDGSERFVSLRNDLRAYFFARNEDSTES